jgi:hypothetical protein
MQSLLQRIKHEPRMRRAADTPADDPAGKGVNDEGDMDLSRIYAALITHLGCLAFESQGAFASQR